MGVKNNMTKSLKEQAREKAAKQKATVMFWDSKGTANITKVRKSINQKVERSEQDVKKHLNDLILPHFILTLFNTVLLILFLIA